MSTTNIQAFSGDVAIAGGLNITGTVTSTAGIDKVTLAEDTTDASRRIIFTTGSTGAQPLKTDAGITYNPSTNTLTAGVFSGSGASISTLNGSNISSGTVAAARVATLNQNTTGSAATLTTARNIGGVSFNGSANIDLPGVNTAGNQNTSGSAATLTTARNIGGVSFNGSANIDLPGVNTAGNQNTSGQAGSIVNQANSATIAASVSAGNNTIVQRHSAGYIFANYFNTNPNDVSSGITKVCVETGNDGYIRHGTADGIRAFIGATSADTASTVVMRDGSGDMFARLFRSDYQDQSDCGAGIAFRNSTNDNYIRFCSDMGAVRARIGCAALAGSTGQNFYVNNIYIGGSTTRGLRSISGQYGTVQVTGQGAGDWEGYSINGSWVFMCDNIDNAGIYNDVDNEWAIYCSRNSKVSLYHNNGEKARTEATGLYMLGTPEMDGYLRHQR